MTRDSAPGDPSRLRRLEVVGRLPFAAERRAELADRLRRNRHADGGMAWGFALCGTQAGDAAETASGVLYAVTPGDAVALTPRLIRATRQSGGRALYLCGLWRAALAVPDTCSAWDDDEPLGAVDLRVLLSDRSRVGSGHLAAQVTWAHAARTPLHFMTPTPLPGWPR